MVNCAVVGCHSTSDTKGWVTPPKVNFFQFPRNPRICEAWLERLGRIENGQPFKPTSHSKLCALHFEQDCFTKTSSGAFLVSVGFIGNFRQRLKPDALPTLNLGLKDTSKRVTKWKFERKKNNLEMASEAACGGEGCKVYKFVSDIDIDSLTDNIIDELCNPDVSEKPWEAELKKISTQVKTAERKQLAVNKLFTECMSQLATFQNTLEDEERQIEEKQKKIEQDLDVASKGPGEVTIIDEDDDDVQFIQKTFDPQLAAKRQLETTMHIKKEAAKLAKVQPASPSPSASTSSNFLQNMRQHLERSLERQSSSSSTPSSVDAKNSRPSASALQLTPATQTALTALQQRKPSSSYLQTSQANQEHMEKMFLKDVNNMLVGREALSRRYGDLWQKVVIMDIIKPHSPIEQRNYKVSYKGKKTYSKLLDARKMAFYEFIDKPVLVGTRIIALYRDEESGEAFYAGIIAEAPNGRNELRYLVFFDDGYAQYCTAKEIHKVFYQSRNVWEDIHPDSQDFVKDYLAQYPERPMVRLHKGQTVKTEWKGKWWVARVEAVDASLVLMYFPADKRSEWIYRGSTRLEPLYTALANAEANRNTGKVKRHNLSAAGAKKPVVEYTRNSSSDALSSSPAKAEKKKAPVAKKSTTQSSTLNTGQLWETGWIKKSKEEKKPSDNRPGSSSGSSRAGKDSSGDRLGPGPVSDDAGAGDLESFGTRRDHILPESKGRRKFTSHSCNGKCLNDLDDDPVKMRGNNPLLIPLFFGWERQVAKAKPAGRRFVFYRAPCGRRLRSLEDVEAFLEKAGSKLAIDNFCCDAELHVHYEFIPVKTFCDIKDLSYGKESVVISCVNGIDRSYPDYVEYSNQRIPATGVKLNLDPEFLVCCDCEDNCRDRSKCKCVQMTVESSKVTNGGRPYADAGYHHRRLEEPLLSGVFECNSQCKCNSRCKNRVVQNGLINRLQVFKTEKRGWGLRCRDDIPRGGFICIYAGQLLTDQGANEDGQQYGDEYLAELDYIEVVERQKEGYESDVEDIDAIDKDDHSDESYYQDKGSDSDDSFKGEEIKFANNGEEIMPGKSHQTRSSERTVKKKQTAQKKTSSTRKSPDIPEPDSTSNEQASGDRDKKRRTGRSTGARYGSINPSKKDSMIEIEDKEEDDSFHGPSTRDFYQDGQSCYIMDAKSMGNIGRYLNHSCSPNAFVQNVFVDTHDLRFPWIAFFAGQYISAGSELTWDYNYEVGSVPGKVLYCYCGSADCRGRLL